MWLIGLKKNKQKNFKKNPRLTVEKHRFGQFLA